MEKECANCGAIREVPDKPEPVTAREGRQVLFNCRECGAVNYRDGTAVLHGQRQGKHGQIPDKVEVPVAAADDFCNATGENSGLVMWILGVIAGLVGISVWLRKRKM